MTSSDPARASFDAPYADLHPDTVLDALDAVGLRGDGRLIQLNSYENRVFQVFLEDDRVVVAKFYRPGRWSDAQILEEHSFAAELAANEIPVAAAWPLELESGPSRLTDITLKGPTLAQFGTELGTYRFSVTQRLAGRAPELEDAGTLEWIGRFIGRMHAVGALKPFEHRLALNPQTFGIDNRDWLLAHDIIPPDALPAWRSTVDAALAAVQAAFDNNGPPRVLRLHGDCHLGNVLWRDGAPHVVDLDDAMQGPAVQDLWMLVSGDHTTMAQQLNTLLEGYEQFCEFDDRERALIEPLRTLRMLRHSAWLAERWGDPTFPRNFPFFGTAAYWNQQTTQFREQVEAIAETAEMAIGPAARTRHGADDEVKFDGDGFA